MEFGTPSLRRCTLPASTQQVTSLASSSSGPNEAQPWEEGGQAMRATAMPRCSWADGGDAAMLAYHDQEWGVPHHDDSALFELLTLEGAQAGLSWRTILARRDEYRRAYHAFDIERIAAHARCRAGEAAGRFRDHPQPAESLLGARQRAHRARRDRRARQPGRLLWSFVGGKPIVNRRRDRRDRCRQRPWCPTR